MPRNASMPLGLQSLKAWFFLGIAGVGLALGFAGLYALRARDLAQREKGLLRLVDEKTQALHAEVAERTRAEEAVRESEALYHSLVENLPINIYRKNCEFGNTLFCETIGKPLEEIIGKTDYDFSDPELADTYRRDDARMMREGKGFQDVEKHLNVNGRQTHIQIMKTPLRGSDGSIRGTQGMFFDITDRVRAEQDLEYERDLLRTLLDYSPDHIYFKDLESRFLRCSATLCRRLGLASQNEAVGRSVSTSLMPNTHRTRWRTSSGSCRPGSRSLEKSSVRSGAPAGPPGF
jgi:PAS domain S-box-containing protein